MFSKKQETPMLTAAKQLIDDYCREEFEREDGADYTDLSQINVACTTTDDGRHEIQANINLVDFRIETYVDDRLAHVDQYKNLEDMVKNALPYLSFDELVYASENDVQPFCQ